MAAKFPKRRSDNSFGIDVLFDSDGAVSAASLDAWLRQWTTANQDWIRKWEGPAGQVVQVDEMRFFEAFTTTPWVSSWSADSLTVRLEATPEAPFWKDWMAKLVQDMVQVFPCLKFRGARDLD